MGSALRRWNQVHITFLDQLAAIDIPTNGKFGTGTLSISCCHKGWMRQNLTILNFIHQIIDEAIFKLPNDFFVIDLVDIIDLQTCRQNGFGF